MGRFGFGTRLAMIVMGAIWCLAGVFWLHLLGPDHPGQGRGNARIVALAAMIAFAGLLLIKTGLTPDRPKSFEEEEGELDPNLRGDHWSDFD